MTPGSFILNNKTSESYGVFIQDRPALATPVRKVEFRSSFGQSGDNPYDEEAYSNTSMQLIMYVTGTEARTASDNRSLVYDWFDSGSYLDLIPYFDPDKIYKVMATTPPIFINKYFHGEGQAFTVDLTVRPYKYQNNVPLKTMTAGGTILNTGSQLALPVIKIFGTGDVTLTINGIPFVIKNIVGHIILDTGLMLAYKEVTGLVTSENSKIYTRNYPFFRKGSNTISWTGTVTKVEIEPRWRTLA